MYYPQEESMKNWKPIVYETVFDDLLWDPYEILYYFMIMPVTRYVNNYGTYKNSVFENNMDRQMRKIGKAVTFKAQNLVRKEFATINNLIDEYNVNVYDKDLNEMLTYHVEYRWETTPGACKICERYHNKLLNKIDMTKIHYNCRCNVVMIEWYEDSKGQKLKYSKKIVT